MNVHSYLDWTKIVEAVYKIYEFTNITDDEKNKITYCCKSTDTKESFCFDMEFV